MLAEAESFVGKISKDAYQNIFARYCMFMEYFLHWNTYSIPMRLSYVAPILIDSRTIQHDIDAEDLLTVQRKERELIDVFKKMDFAPVTIY